MAALLVNLHQSEKPRERLARAGAASLSLREILAVLLGSGPKGLGCLGTADAILRSGGHGPDSAEAERFLLLTLATVSWPTFPGVKGLGPAGRSRLAAAFELGRRYACLFSAADCGGLNETTLVRRAVARIPRLRWLSSAEWLGFVPVYGDGTMGAFCCIGEGGQSRVSVEAKDLFRALLALRPEGFLLAHNHPSGSLEASDEDVALTQRVAAIADALDVPLFGHVIVSRRGWARVDGESPCGIPEPAVER